MSPAFRSSLLCATAVALVGAISASVAEASHFRGASMIPSVDASGLLTLTSTTFWRTTAPSSIDESANPTVGGVGTMADVGPSVNDTSDSRFTKNTNVHSIQLPGAGTYAITATSCCRVAGAINSGSTSWFMNSTIFWDGSTANTPILFDFSAIQVEVLRGGTYSDTVGAVSGNGGTLSYDQALNLNLFAQPPGFAIDTTTGAMSIPSGSTPSYTDNVSGNPGADAAYSGNIFNDDGSSVEFEWMFDGVDSTGNLAPDVEDIVINALVGDLISEVIEGIDPNLLDTVLLDLLSFLDIGAAIAPVFTPGAAGNPTTGTLDWDTTGSALGTYVFNIRGTDSSGFTDVGSITINLDDETLPPGVPTPGTLALLGTGLAALGFIRRRRPAGGVS